MGGSHKLNPTEVLQPKSGIQVKRKWVALDFVSPKLDLGEVGGDTAQLSLVPQHRDSPTSKSGGCHAHWEPLAFDGSNSLLELVKGFVPLDIPSQWTHLKAQVFAHIEKFENLPIWGSVLLTSS